MTYQGFRAFLRPTYAVGPNPPRPLPAPRGRGADGEWGEASPQTGSEIAVHCIAWHCFAVH